MVILFIHIRPSRLTQPIIKIYTLIIDRLFSPLLPWVYLSPWSQPNPSPLLLFLGTVAFLDHLSLWHATLPLMITPSPHPQVTQQSNNMDTRRVLLEAIYALLSTLWPHSPLFPLAVLTIGLAHCLSSPREYSNPFWERLARGGLLTGIALLLPLLASLVTIHAHPRLYPSHPPNAYPSEY